MTSDDLQAWRSWRACHPRWQSRSTLRFVQLLHARVDRADAAAKAAVPGVEELWAKLKREDDEARAAEQAHRSDDEKEADEEAGATAVGSSSTAATCMTTTRTEPPDVRALTAAASLALGPPGSPTKAPPVHINMGVM